MNLYLKREKQKQTLLGGGIKIDKSILLGNERETNQLVSTPLSAQNHVFWLDIPSKWVYFWHCTYVWVYPFTWSCDRIGKVREFVLFTEGRNQEIDEIYVDVYLGMQDNERKASYLGASVRFCFIDRMEI